MSKSEAILKRIFDFTISLLGLILLSPLFAIISILIKIDDPDGSVFYKDKRIGKDGSPFYMYKFRSMIKNAVNYGLGLEVAENDWRITRIGRFLRKYSLDEIPQLINVLKGEMSIIGPRPPLPHQVEKYTEFEKRRLEVKPGITGWAQINGRNLLTWKERIKYDIWYIDHYSFFLDINILSQTPKIILSGKGLYGKNGITKDYE